MSQHQTAPGHVAMPCPVCQAMARVSPVAGEPQYLVQCDRCMVYRIDRSAAGPLLALTVDERGALSEYLRTHQGEEAVILTIENTAGFARGGGSVGSAE